MTEKPSEFIIEEFIAILPDHTRTVLRGEGFVTEPCPGSGKPPSDIQIRGKTFAYCPDDCARSIVWNAGLKAWKVER